MMKTTSLFILCLGLSGMIIAPSAMAVFSCSVMGEIKQCSDSDDSSSPIEVDLGSEYSYKLCYFGRIDDLVVNENVVSFNAVNLWRFARIRSTDGSYWDIALTHYEDVPHYLEGYEFHGLLLDSFIWGRFTK